MRRLAAAALLATLALPSGEATAAEINLNVPGDHATIQAAVTIAANDAANSYVITVERGTYAGGITISNHPNALTIRGRETAQTEMTGGNPLILISGNVSGNTIIIKNLLFSGASNAVEIRNNTSGILVRNCIFAVGSTNTGILAQGSPSVSLWDNTFYQNGAAVSRDVDTVTIRNNLFYNSNNVDISQTNPLMTAGITNNLFYPNPAAGDVIGSNAQPDNINYFNSNLSFASQSTGDFHLQSGTTGTSPGIDTGDTLAGADSIDGTRADIGAYGGSESDTIPFPVSILSSSSTVTIPASVTLSWSSNTDYRVTGYNVYYRLSTIPSKTYVDPPVIVIGSTSTVISGLTATVATPAQPSFTKVEPRNGILIISWSGDTSATGYNLGYHLASDPTTTIPLGNVTSYTLSGLTNNQTYHLTLSAVKQPILYSAVTASYDVPSGGAGVPGESFESSYSAEHGRAFGTAVEGPVAETTGTPELLVPYPNLPNTGCFIATAAYGAPDALPVRILREFRDRRLLTHPTGRAVVAWYYRTSPALAAWLNEHPAAKPAVRMGLEPVIATAAIITYAPAAVILALVVLLFPVRGLLRRRAS